MNVSQFWYDYQLSDICAHRLAYHEIHELESSPLPKGENRMRQAKKCGQLSSHIHPAHNLHAPSSIVAYSM